MESLCLREKNQTRFKGWFVLLHNFTDLHGTGRIKRWIRFSLSVDANRPFSHTILFYSKAHVRQRISLRILCFYVCFKVIRGKVANGNIKFHYKPLAASSLIYTDPSLEAQSAHKSFSTIEESRKICDTIKLSEIFIFVFFSGESSETSISDLFKLPIVEWYEACYLYGLVVLELYCSAIHPFTVLAVKLPFLPLMLTSVYCAVGVIWAWILFYVDTLTSSLINRAAVSTIRETVVGKQSAKKKQWNASLDEGQEILQINYSRLV